MNKTQTITAAAAILACTFYASIFTEQPDEESSVAFQPKKVSLMVKPGHSYNEVRMNSKDTLQLVLDRLKGRIWRISDRQDGSPVLEVLPEDRLSRTNPQYRLIYMRAAKDQLDGRVIGGRCFVRLETIRRIEDNNDWSNAESSEIEVMVSTQDI